MKKRIIFPGLIVIIVLSATVYASTVSVSSTTNGAMYGVSFTNSNVFTAQDTGFSVQGSNQAASALPCTWTNGGNCRQALTINHYKYTIVVILKTVPSVATTYTVTAKWDLGAGQSMIGGSALTVRVPNTATVGQSMTMHFDTGSTTFSTPQSMDITIT